MTHDQRFLALLIGIAITATALGIAIGSTYF